jgi:hypothetical protein
MRDNITTGEIPFRKAYIRSLVDRIEVDDHVVRIVGNKATLEQAVAHGALVEIRFAVLNRSGAPDTIRTCDLCLRRATLYPAELRALTVQGG